MWSGFQAVISRAETLKAQEEATASILIPPTKPCLSTGETSINKQEPQKSQPQRGLKETRTTRLFWVFCVMFAESGVKGCQ